MNGNVRFLATRERTWSIIRGIVLTFLCFSVSSFSCALALQTPVQKWIEGGCNNGWCQTGWYSSPAVADLDGDGDKEVIWASYKIFVLDGATGELEWEVYAGHDREYMGSESVGRTWAGVVVADIDNDSELEIITAHGGGCVSVYTFDGYFENNWPQTPASNEFRSLSVDDLDNDGLYEIVVGCARSQNYNNIYVFEPDGSIRPGWPQLSSGTSSYGIYSKNIAIADIDNDGLKEIIAPSDTITVCAFKPDGSRILANPMYQTTDKRTKYWGEVKASVDLVAEIRGWENCGIEHRANFAHDPASIADLDGDGFKEVVLAGNVHNCGTSPYTDLFITPYVFNADRSRFQAGPYDWTVIPQNTGAPICQDYNIIESCLPNPVLADLDSDGLKEILFPSYDGRLHCFWLDKTEHGNWPYEVYVPPGVFRFASEPAVVDIDNDNLAEIVFGTWPVKAGDNLGHLVVCDHLGNELAKITVPVPQHKVGWNGILGCPTLADIDGDSDLEIVVGTAHTGVCAYDIPDSQNARLLWPTGRGNYLRNGQPPNPAVVPEIHPLSVLLLVMLIGILARISRRPGSVPTITEK